MLYGTPAPARPSAHTRLRDWLIWFGVLGLVTVAMLSVRAQLDKAHVALILLLVVLGASGAAGRLVGLSVVAAAFFTFNFFFLPPYTKLTIYNPLDWLI